MEHIIFGAGENTKKITRCLKQGEQVTAYIDNNIEKQGKVFLNCRVISLNDISDYYYDFLIVASINYEEIVEQLVDCGIVKEKIITPFSFRHSDYNAWRKFLNIEELIYIEMEQKISGLYEYIDNMEYELASKIINKRLRFPKILSWEKAIEEIVKNGKSISRFGDGEFDLMLGKKHTFQAYDQELVDKMKEVLKSNIDNLIVGLPDAYGDFEGRTDDLAECFRRHFQHGTRQKEYELIDMSKVYYDSFMTRPYKTYLDKTNVREKFLLLKTIWQDRDLTIIEGEKTRLGVGNDLFDNARSCIRILGPCLSAYSKYDELLSEALKTDKNRLVLIAMGATATVMAYDLAKAGYQAVDIGHIDIEYEWYLRGAEKKVAIEGKYVHEVPGGGNVAEYYNDDKYNSEIVKVIR